MKKKNKLIIELIVITILLFVVGGVIINVIWDKPSTKEELTKYLESMGKDFYINFYYDETLKDLSSKDKEEYLKKFEKIGIKVSLTGLSQYNLGQNDKMISKFKTENGDECDRNNTKVIIYPKKPYGKNNFTIETKLDCNFNELNK